MTFTVKQPDEMRKSTFKNFSSLICLLWMYSTSFGQEVQSQKANQFLKLDSLTADSVLINHFNPFEISAANKYYFFKTNFLDEFEFWKVPKLSTNYFTILNSEDTVMDIEFNKSSFPHLSNMLKFNAAFMFHHTYRIQFLEKSIVISILNKKDKSYFFYSRLDFINENEIDVPLEILIKEQK